jgi:hypothetical protein
MGTSLDRQTRSFCGGACTAATAMCEVCAAAQRRGSLGNALAGLEREAESQDEEELELLEDEEIGDVWPPHPFQCVFSRSHLPLSVADLFFPSCRPTRLAI